MPRVTYWTGVWAPGREALSNEIELLRSSQRTASPVVSFASRQSTSLVPHGRAVRLNGSRWMLLRAIAACAEWSGDVTHVFGGLGEWHLLRALGRRPTIFTVAIDGTAPASDLWDRVDVFAAETETLARALIRAGAPADRIQVVRPGVDLHQFAPRVAPPPRPFRVLFASSPACVSEFEPRGIRLLVDVARACRDVEIVLCWRSWGNQAEARRALEALEPPTNLVISSNAGQTMSDAYASAHAVVCAYAPGFGKSAPNSVIEGLACGRPAILTDSCGLAEVVTGTGAGVSAARAAGALSAAIETVRARYDEFATAARHLAEREFDADRFLRAYGTLYSALARQRARGAPVPAGLT